MINKVALTEIFEELTPKMHSISYVVLDRNGMSEARYRVITDIPDGMSIIDYLKKHTLRKDQDILSVHQIHKPECRCGFGCGDKKPV